jgi:hypothetical protein
VVNDCAELAVKLAIACSKTLAHDDYQRRLIFQVVEFYHQLMTLPHKKNYTE